MAAAAASEAAVIEAVAAAAVVVAVSAAANAAVAGEVSVFAPGGLCLLFHTWRCVSQAHIQCFFLGGRGGAGRGGRGGRGAPRGGGRGGRGGAGAGGKKVVIVSRSPLVPSPPRLSCCCEASPSRLVLTLGASNSRQGEAALCPHTSSHSPLTTT